MGGELECIRKAVYGMTRNASIDFVYDDLHVVANFDLNRDRFNMKCSKRNNISFVGQWVQATYSTGIARSGNSQDLITVHQNRT